MTLQVILGALISVAGFLAAGLGVLFLIASHGIASRLIAGFVLGGAGIAAFALGVIMFRRGMRASPGGIRKEILRLARMGNGEVTEEAVTGALGSSDTVRFQLIDLVRSGVARELRKDNRTVYLFEDFQAKLVLKKCPYCGNDYPVRDDIERCPSCGGDLKMHRSALAREDTSYSMDEDDDSHVT
ncbi:MAG: zinc ribbon domain-containing protein [Spirochaetes bacterium]|nr:zinc ribbon domain-containing protein [Spirochaetota bacterium]